jgi:hypothetical protein
MAEQTETQRINISETNPPLEYKVSADLAKPRGFWGKLIGLKPRLATTNELKQLYDATFSKPRGGSSYNTQGNITLEVPARDVQTLQRTALRMGYSIIDSKITRIKDLTKKTT